MKIILFKCIGVLVNGQKMRRCYRENMAHFMSARYGKAPDVWAAADEQIVSDWTSYHADLNFSGDDGIADIHEGLFRVTRALFKITGISEPSKSEITALANELISIPCKHVLLPDVLPVLQQCQKKGFVIGTFSYFLEKQVRAITTQIDNLSQLIGADTLNHYEHDLMYFRKLSAHLHTTPDKIIIVATSSQTIAAATQSGMQTVLMRQSPTSLEQALTHILEQ